MKFSILQSDLLDALQVMSGVVPSKSTTPVLENVLFDLEGEALKLTGTDLEVSITTTVSPRQTDAGGSLALPAKVITEMMRSLPDIPVHFESDENNRVVITTEKGRYQISGIAKENYPEIPAMAEARSIDLENKVLRRMLSKTIFAVSSEELRPALMGVFIQMMADEFRMVATDGHRLSKILDKNFQYNESPVRMIVPPKAVQIALRNLDQEGTTKLLIEENGLSFVFDGTTLYTRLVDGEYPDYERVIPRDNDKKLIVNKSALIDSVKRVSLFSSALTHQIRFSLSNGKLLICSEDVDIGGEGREELDVDYTEEDMEIGYNAHYILDIIKHIDTEQVLFQLKSPVRATLVMPSDQKENESFIMLIMPIKLSGS